jgi:hypothetical protein
LRIQKQKKRSSNLGVFFMYLDVIRDLDCPVLVLFFPMITGFPAVFLAVLKNYFLVFWTRRPQSGLKWTQNGHKNWSEKIIIINFKKKYSLNFFKG